MKKLCLLPVLFVATFCFGQTASTATVTLSWPASVTPAAQLSKYNVYRGPVATGPFASIGNSGNATTLTFIQTIALTTSAQTYSYLVRSVATDGTTESADSNIVTVSLPAIKPAAVSLKCSLSISPSGSVTGTCQ